MDSVQPGMTLGAYRVIAQIGQGGMATVYRAYHAAMDRYVAIKVLPYQPVRSEEALARFQQEARTIAKLEHPHILPVYDYGQHEGITYFVMRLLDAGDLKTRIKAGAVSLNEVDRLFTQIADALGYAHEHGVIHRDIKPSNVMIDARGDAFLTDFGIAKLVESNIQLTASGAITGTPAYMSPEQAQGEKIDQRSDIYALGIVLYEMLLGRVPFEAETPLAVILKHITDPLPLPTQLNPTIAPAIERVLLKALAKNKEERFATCADFLTAWKQAFAEAMSASAAGLTTPAAPLPPQTVTSITPPSSTSTPPLTPTPTPISTSTLPSTPATPVGFIARLRGVRRRTWALGCGGALFFCCCLLALANRNAPPAEPPSAPAMAVTVQAAAATIQAAAGVVSNTIATQIATPAPSVSAPSPTTPVRPTIAPTSAQPSITHWAAANSVYSVAMRGDDIVAGAHGSVLIWKRDGSSYERFTTFKEQLPDPEVNVVYADSDGAVWVGTSGGLARYDAKGWTTYTKNDGLDQDTISAITRWNDKLIIGTLYAREGGGLNQFDGKEWKSLPFPSAHNGGDKLSNNVHGLLADKGTLWVATANGLGRYDGKTWTRYSTVDGLTDNSLRVLFVDKQGVLWVSAFDQAGVAKFDGKKFEAVRQLQGIRVTGMTQDKQGRYWFATSNGLMRYDPDRAKWDLFGKAKLPSFLPSEDFFGAAQDKEGNLYFGNEGGGLLIVRPDDKFDGLMAKNVPSFAAYEKILLAPDGQLWFRADGYGFNVDRFNPNTQTWSRVTDLPCGYCTALGFDANGNLWAASDEGLWFIGKDGKTTRFTMKDGLPMNELASARNRAIAFTKDGTAWIATPKGVVVSDGKSIKQVHSAKSAGFSDDNIRALFAHPDGTMWVGAEKGVSHLKANGQWEHFTIGKPFSNRLESVTDLDVGNLGGTGSGNVWVTTAGDGLWRFNTSNQTWQQMTPTTAGVRLPSAFVHSVVMVPVGAWFGTARGAVRYLVATNEWLTLTAADGELIHSDVRDVLVVGNTIYFATSGGVTRYVGQ
jgi:serine/threonine protein kinase/ligand-binding sensor domain-containing protein